MAQRKSQAKGVEVRLVATYQTADDTGPVKLYAEGGAVQVELPSTGASAKLPKKEADAVVAAGFAEKVED